MSDLFYRVTRLQVLEAAWRQVREKGLKSASREIKSETQRFDAKASYWLRSIQGRLLRGSFTFEKQIGVAKKRPGKTARPIVIAPLENRIVQRAILEVLKDFPPISDVLNIPTSFGGIEGVDGAIALVVEEFGRGAKWHMRSDIPGFFTAIPKDTLSKYLRALGAEEKFCELCDRAVEVELSNQAGFSTEEIAVFPLGPVGVAQGSALSALIGNVLLRGFDCDLNGRGVVCIRYIDDFLLLGSSRRSVMAAFQSAKRILLGLGLDVYDPAVRPDKASEGPIEKGVEFLGCSIIPGMVSPSKKARAALLQNVRGIIKGGFAEMVAAKARRTKNSKGATQIRSRVDRVVKGWGEAFAFCNSRQVFERLDKDIDQELRRLQEQEARLLTAASASMARRISGVQLLVDIRPKPLRLSSRGK